MPNLTVKDIAAKFSVDNQVAQGLVVFLSAKDAIRKSGTRRSGEKVKGKSANVWETPNTLTINFTDASIVVSEPLQTPPVPVEVAAA